MWAVVSNLQLMSYITLMNLYFPDNLIIFLGWIESVHNFNKWMPNILGYMVKSGQVDISPLNDQFASRGFNSRIMVLLCGGDLQMLALSAVAIIILSLLSQHGK